MRLPLQCKRIEAILYKRTDGKIQYLILKRQPPKSRPEIGQFWQPITGGLEGGETKKEALKREIKEETGIENLLKIIENVHYYEPVDLPLMEHLRRHGYECQHLEAYAFGVEVSSDEEVTLGEEHSEYRWVSFQEALTLIRGIWYEHEESLRKLMRLLENEHVYKS
jgi:dATP pyrophosphohydrolase